MKSEKFSRQRELLIKNLECRFDHPTAEMLYESLKGEISLPTVYRNLSQLAKDGRVMRITAEGSDRFDAVTRDHAHFECTHCGCVTDVAPQIRFESGEMLDGCKITGSRIMLYGICRSCIDKLN